MSEAAPTPAPSEAVTPAADAAPAVTPVDGGDGGTQVADQFATQLETFRREAQSREDKVTAQLKALESRLPAPAEPAAAEPAPALTVEQMRQEMRRDRELSAAAVALKTEFPDADPTIFDDLDSFESAESLRAAAESSHKSMGTLIASRVAVKEAEIRAQYAAKYGDLGPVEPVDTTPTGDPTLDQLGAMSMAQLAALPEGTVERVERATGHRL